jgi:hypothetical protein
MRKIILAALLLIVGISAADAQADGIDPLSAMLAQQGAPAPLTTQAWEPGLWVIYATIHDSTVARIDGGLDAIIGAQIAWVNTFLKVVITVLLMGAGIAMAMGRADLHGLVRVLLRYAVVLFLLASAGNVHAWGLDTLANLPTEWGNAVTAPLGGGAFQGAGIFDKVADSILVASLRTYEALPSLSLKGIGMSIAVIVFCFVSELAIMVAFAVWFLAVLSLKMALVFSVIAIASLLHPASKRIFDNWIGVVLGAVGTQVMVVAVLTIEAFGTAVTTDQVNLAPGNNAISMLQALMVMTLISCVMAIFVKQVPQIAAAIFNGVYLGISDYTSAAAAGASGAAAGVRGLANLLNSARHQPGMPSNGGGGGGGRIPRPPSTPVGRSLSS